MHAVHCRLKLLAIVGINVEGGNSYSWSCEVCSDQLVAIYVGANRVLWYFNTNNYIKQISLGTNWYKNTFFESIKYTNHGYYNDKLD